MPRELCGVYKTAKNLKKVAVVPTNPGPAKPMVLAKGEVEEKGERYLGTK